MLIYAAWHRGGGGSWSLLPPSVSQVTLNGLEGRQEGVGKAACKASSQHESKYFSAFARLPSTFGFLTFVGGEC